MKAEVQTTSKKLTFTKVSGADGYVIYGAPCGSESKLVKITELSSSQTSYQVTGLEKDTCYKYMVKAYKVINGKKVIMTVSRMVHSTTVSKKYANPTKVNSGSSSITLKVELPRNWHAR
ncbi:MAG: hypothetical protein QM644_07590 [Mobilitalea sp.]